MTDLMNRMLKLSKCKDVEILSESTLFDDVDYAPMKALILNIAWSAKIKGGIHSGLTMIAGPSRHFKSLLGLIAVKAYLEKYDDAICIFFDSEFGSGKDYWESLGIDPKRVIYEKIKNIEELKFNLMAYLDEDKKESIKKEDHVVIFIDSIGNLASKKEVDDTKDSKSVADMTRAKALKGLWRMMTPYINILDIPLLAIAHTYKTMDRYPQDVVGGGTGNMYSPNNLFIISRSKVKDDDGIAGFTFKLKTEKSRFVKEGTIFPFKVTYKGGLSPFSGLFDIALKTKHIKQTSKGWYKTFIEGEECEKQFRRGDVEISKDFWIPILKTKSFNDAVYELFHYDNGQLIRTDKENE